MLYIEFDYLDVKYSIERFMVILQHINIIIMCQNVYSWATVSSV